MPRRRLRAKNWLPCRGLGAPRSTGVVTPQTLFRGFTTEDIIGPYVSQFLLRPFNYGQYAIDGQIVTYVPGIDYLTDQGAWLAARNGQGPFGKNQPDSSGEDFEGFQITKFDGTNVPV